MISQPPRSWRSRNSSEATTPSANYLQRYGQRRFKPKHSPGARLWNQATPNTISERGISAYRSGDLYLALVDFDLAISLDPGASDAYIDRAIVYHRMGDLKRAFADVSQAKRIET